MRNKRSLFLELSSPIAQRILILLAALVLSGFGLLLLLDLQSSYRWHYDAALRDSENLSLVLEHEITAAVGKMDVVLQNGATTFAPALTEGKTWPVLDANRELDRWMTYIPEAQKQSLRVSDNQGHIVYNAGQTTALPDVVVADRAYFLRQKNDPNAGLVISEPLLSRFTGKWLITLSRRISDHAGNFAGLVQTALVADFFQSLFEGLDVGQHGNVSLFDMDFRLMSRMPALPDRLGQIFENAEVRNGLASGATSGHYEIMSRVDSVRRLFLYRKLQGLPYVVVIGRAPEDFMADWRRKAWLYAVAFTGLTLAMLYSLRLVQKQNRQSRQLVSRIFETTREGILVTDQHGAIIKANDAFQRITGYETDEVLGKTTALLKSGMHPAEFYTEMWQTLKEKGEWRGEVWNRRKNGETFPALLSINALKDKDGLSDNFICIFSDIAELHQARQQAELASRAKSEFLATMSHEIRTPMNGILGMTGMLLDTRLDKDQKHFAETIRISAESLLSIINDILDFSRIEAGKLSLEPYPFDMHSVVEGVADLLAPKVAGKHLEMSVYIDPALAGEYRGDAGRIRQILLNLVGNAVKFTEKGSIAITASHNKDGNNTEWLRVSVADTGIGIPDDAKPLLFAEFSQADASTTRRFGGSGLGLAICRKLVTLMKGEIGFESQMHEGSRFWFSIPLERLNTSHQAPQQPLLGLQILVIDDTPTNTEIFSRQIEGWGGQVVSALSAREGLTILGQPDSSFDLLILDHHMPGMTGLDVARHCKADPVLQKLKLLLASSAPTPAIQENPASAGLDLVLAKPVRPSALLDAILRLTGRPAVGAAEAGNTGSPAGTSSLPPPPARPLRILVAEDNAINQQVATGLLARLGHRADVAHNGGEAVVLVERGEYDLVLMDVQMPEMDGIAATKVIRAFKNSKADIPIIAMTANAMAGDREALLAVGMNDYIAKPISRRSLHQLLEHWMNKIISAGDQPEDKQPQPEIQATVYARTDLIDDEAQTDLAGELGQNRFLDLVNRFFTQLTEQTEQTRQALEAGDTNTARRVVHGVKGAAGNLGFCGLQNAAMTLEKTLMENGDNGAAELAELIAVAEQTRNYSNLS